MRGKPKKAPHPSKVVEGFYAQTEKLQDELLEMFREAQGAEGRFTGVSSSSVKAGRPSEEEMRLSWPSWLINFEI